MRAKATSNTGWVKMNIDPDEWKEKFKKCGDGQLLDVLGLMYDELTRRKLDTRPILGWFDHYRERTDNTWYDQLKYAEESEEGKDDRNTK